MNDWDDEYDDAPRRPRPWVKVVAVVAAASLVLPLVVAAVRLVT